MQEKKTVDIALLCSLLNVSDVTVRKDLDNLEKQGYLIKTHGGAILSEENYQNQKEKVNIEISDEEKEIAELSSNLIEDYDTIFLGAGSTCLALAKCLDRYENITVVTNNINALTELAPNIKKLYLVGGEIIYDKGMLSASGASSFSFLEGIFVNKAFIGVDGIDLMSGFTINEYFLSILYKKLSEISKQVIILADYTKFNKMGLFQIGNADFPYCVVSNEKMDDNYKQYFFKNNIKALTTYEL